MGTKGRSGWGAGSVTRVPGGRWCQSVGIKGRLTHTVGWQQCYLLRNKGALGQVQAGQANMDAEPPVFVCAQPRGWKGGWTGSCCSGAPSCQGMLQVLLRLGHSPGQSLHAPRRAWELPVPVDIQAEHWGAHQEPGSPPAVPCLCCSCSHFWPYAMLEGRGSSRAGGDAGSLHPHGAPWSVPNWETGHPTAPASTAELFQHSKLTREPGLLQSKRVFSPGINCSNPLR